jgi:hypothetical protein
MYKFLEVALSPRAAGQEFGATGSESVNKIVWINRNFAPLFIMHEIVFVMHACSIFSLDDRTQVEYLVQAQERRG